MQDVLDRRPHEREVGVVAVGMQHRGWALDGTFTAMPDAIRADKDAAGDSDWLVVVDSTLVRAHQHATGARRGTASGTNRRITPSADPEED